MQTVHAPTMRKVYKLLKLQGISPDGIAVKKNKFLKDNSLYMMTVVLQDAKDIMVDLHLFDDMASVYDRMGLKKRCCKAAYLRGAFLGSGSISDPKGPYHMEFAFSNRNFADTLSGLINEFRLNSKVMERKNNYMVYLKGGDSISDLLGIMGAHNSLLKFEDIRVLKEMRNSVNRRVNCETANLNKTIRAAFRQIDAIDFLMEKNEFDDLPENLKEVARLRLEYPDLSLQELGNFMTPILGKSGVSYRLKKIEGIADKFKQERGE